MSNRRINKAGRPLVHRREVFSACAPDRRADFAYCKTRRASVETTLCESCPTLLHGSPANGDFLCAMETLEVERPPAPRRAGNVDLREAVSVASATEVMDRHQLLVRADTAIERVRELFLDRAVHSVPVVDDEGKLIGMVSESDVLRWQAGRSPSDATNGTVANIMSPVAHALPERAPLAYAFGLLAVSGMHEAPVVTDDGKVVGAITSNDLLRWVARDLGYVLDE